MDLAAIQDQTAGLVKERLASQLRAEILSGRLSPGERIVEGRWARQLGAAQASVREALNILAAEGFVQKGHGHSACVIQLSASDVRQLYVVRAALESTAARLVAEQRVDLRPLEDVQGEIHEALAGGDLRTILDRVMQFHLKLCKLSGNSYLMEAAERLVVPLFAFTLMRALAYGVGPQPWIENAEIRQRILTALGSGDPFFAEQYVRRAILSFGEAAEQVWLRRDEESSPKRRARKASPRQPAELRIPEY
jgi:DNA-binding GntR family transcriptional regulator